MFFVSYNLNWEHPVCSFRLHADMAYYGNKLADVDPNGIVGTRLMKQVKELVLLDKRNGQANPTTATNNNTKENANLGTASANATATIAAAAAAATTNDTTTNSSAASSVPTSGPTAPPT